MALMEINGAQLDVRERGAGEPVVFSHGAMGDECAAVVEEPALTDRYRVVDYHRRGWGKSTCPETPVSMEQNSADLKTILERLDIERAHVVGQSGGGIVMLQFTLDSPESVQTLTVLEPALPSVIMSTPEMAALMQKAVSLYVSGDKRGAIETFANEVSGPDVEATMAAMDKNLPPGYLERWLASADTLFQADLANMWSFTAEDASRIKQPVLNIRGENTQPYFRTIYETVQEWLPQAESKVLPDASHAMLQMNPSGAAERIADFIARHPIA